MFDLVRWKERARALKRDTYALYLAYHDARTPWYARVVALCVVAYAFSPIDLIPDFIPVLGYLDDLILVPLGIALAVRLIPPEVMAQSRERAQQAAQRPQNWFVAAAIVALWLGTAALAGWLVLRAM